MQLTLLQLVQDMVSAIDAEEVTDVSETEEAGMCVNIANRCYEQMMAQHRWRHLRTYSQLTADTNLNDLKLPTGGIAIDPLNVWYNQVPMTYYDPETFLALTIGRDTSESNIELQGNIRVFNDRDPQYFTSDDDETLRFESMPDSGGLDATLSMALIYKLPTSRKSVNADIFDLPAVAFPTLSSLCISRAIGELKGDAAGAAAELRTYKGLMGSLARNARLIDKLGDKRKHIVARLGARFVLPVISE